MSREEWIHAHVTSLQALYPMYETSISWDYPDILAQCGQQTLHLNIFCEKGTVQEIQEAHSAFVETLMPLQVREKMLAIDTRHASKPLYYIMFHYMQMVVEIMMFIRSVLTQKWTLHLASFQAVTKYCFAHDRLAYAGIIHLYLADMEV